MARQWRPRMIVARYQEPREIRRCPHPYPRKDYEFFWRRARAASSPLFARFQAVRDDRSLAQPLSPEDCQIQSMADASPVKWHLAHTTWFFETFVLAPHARGFSVFHPSFTYLFNSYYNAVGERLARPRRAGHTAHARSRSTPTERPPIARSRVLSSRRGKHCRRPSRPSSS